MSSNGEDCAPIPVKPQVLSNLVENVSSSISSSSVKRTRSSSASEIDVEQSTSWKGWAELENDPMVFATLLREWGVSGVQIHEVVHLDMIQDSPSDSLLGLVFLSRWVAAETTNTTSEIPGDLWFANQISSFSCATVALLNIINNHPELSLGPQLAAFRDNTIDLSPKNRGLALDSFDHVRNVHNSFATDLDKMVVDLQLKDDVTVAARRKRAKTANANPKRKGRGRKKKVRKQDDSDEEEGERGFHFVAYVPSKDFVWRLDGMEAMPRAIGSITAGVNWLTIAVQELQSLLASAATNQFEFSLMSLSKCENNAISTEDSHHMLRVREDWGPFIAQLITLHAERGDLQDLLT